MDAKAGLVCTHNTREFSPLRRFDTDLTVVISRVCCNELCLFAEPKRHFMRGSSAGIGAVNDVGAVYHTFIKYRALLQRQFLQARRHEHQQTIQELAAATGFYDPLS